MFIGAAPRFGDLMKAMAKLAARLMASVWRLGSRSTLGGRSF